MHVYEFVESLPDEEEAAKLRLSVVNMTCVLDAVRARCQTESSASIVLPRYVMEFGRLPSIYQVKIMLFATWYMHVFRRMLRDGARLLLTAPVRNTREVCWVD